MNNFNEIINIEMELYEMYMELAECSSESTEIKSKIENLRLLEDIEFEKIFLDKDIDSLIETFPDDIEFEEKSGFEEIIMKRFITKCLKRLFEFGTLANFTKYLLEDYLDESEIKEHFSKAFDYIKEEKRFEDGPEMEIDKAYIVFSKEYIEKESNPEIKKILLKNILTNIYSNVSLEEDFIQNGFHIPDNWLCLSDGLMFSEEKRKDYYSYLRESSLSLIEFVLNLSFNYKWGIDNGSRILAYETKSHLRAALYLLNEEDALEVKDGIIELAESLEEENKAGAGIIMSALKESEKDFENQNKVILPFEKSEIEKFEENTYSLYQRLASLEKKSYDGVDTSLDIDDVIEALRVKKVNEIALFKKEMLSKAKFDFYEGLFICSINLENAPYNIQERSEKIFDSLEEYVLLKKEDYSEREAVDAIKLPKYNELHKNIVYFLDESIQVANEDIRNYLIDSKYDYIFENVDFEDEALEYGFCFSKEELRCPSCFEFDVLKRKRHEEELSMVVKETMYDAISEFEELFEIEDNQDGLYQKLISTLRGCFYTFNEEEYNNTLNDLNALLPEIENIYIVSALSNAIKLSIQDREKYPKLVLS